MTHAQSEFARAQRRRFYRDLHRATGIPQHGKALGRGFSWPASIEGQEVIYNHCLTLAYSGGWAVGDESPIPRAYVNIMDRNIWRVPHSTKMRWLPTHLIGQHVTFARSPIQLELTCTIGELPDFATWLVGYLTAQEQGDLARLPRAPHALEDVPELGDDGYIWTKAASVEYGKRRERYEAQLASIQRARETQASARFMPGGAFAGPSQARQNGRTPRGTVAKIESLACLPLFGASAAEATGRYEVK